MKRALVLGAALTAFGIGAQAQERGDQPADRWSALLAGLFRQRLPRPLPDLRPRRPGPAPLWPGQDDQLHAPGALSISQRKRPPGRPDGLSKSVPPSPGGEGKRPT